MTELVWLEDLISGLVQESPENRLEEFGGQPIFDAPVLGIADGDDPLFMEYGDIVSRQHIQPRPFLERHAPEGTDLTHAIVVVWALPFTREIRRSNRNRDLPSRLYSLARNNGGALIYRMSSRLTEILQTQGYAAVSPTLTSDYNVFRAPDLTFSSTWSERHVAYCAGLGHFGLNAALITSLGINVRLGSIIVNLPVECTPRTHDNYQAPCLEDGGASCRSCIDNCPVGAITPEGLDKPTCNIQRKEVQKKYLETYQQELNMLPTPISINGHMQDRISLGCALCQCGVPCEDKDPFATPSETS